jgi:hypothetical protein
MEPDVVDIKVGLAVGGQKSDQALQIDFCPPTTITSRKT